MSNCDAQNSAVVHDKGFKRSGLTVVSFHTLKKKNSFFLSVFCSGSIVFYNLWQTCDLG